MKLVVGLSGQKGAGKTEFHKILHKILVDTIGSRFSISRHGTSDLLKETLNSWNLPVTRANLQALPIVMGDAFGNDSLMNAIKRRITEDSADIIIVDALRRLEADVSLIRSFPNNLIVYIEASPVTRWRRLFENSEKEGEKGISYLRFQKEDQAPIEKEIILIGDMADVLIENGTSYDIFQSKIEKSVLPLIERSVNSD